MERALEAGVERGLEAGVVEEVELEPCPHASEHALVVPMLESAKIDSRTQVVKANIRAQEFQACTTVVMQTAYISLM